jgi:hypothetical protein
MLGPTKIRIGTWAIRPAASTLFRNRIPHREERIFTPVIESTSRKTP